jgi:hypothetical protein
LAIFVKNRTEQEAVSNRFEDGENGVRREGKIE